MKKPSLKKFFAFIIVLMVFSISYLNAQCPGNKVKMYKPVSPRNCISKCVSPNQVEKYMSNGWFFSCITGGSGVFAKPTGKKIQNKQLEKNPGRNAIVSKKAEIKYPKNKG